jgi:hypothetical protein
MNLTKTSCSPMFTAMFTAANLYGETSYHQLVNMVNMNLKPIRKHGENMKLNVYTLRIRLHVHHVHRPHVSPTLETVSGGEHAGEHAVNMRFSCRACSPARRLPGKVTP